MSFFTLYHYTRNFPEIIKSEGLKVLDWDKYRLEIHKNIPLKHQKKFNFLKNNSCSLGLIQNSIREGFIHLTTAEEDDSPLQFYYGGEYLRKCININYKEDETDLLGILEAIGKPLRIKIYLPCEFLDQNNLSKLIEIEKGVFSGGNHTDIALEKDIPPCYIEDVSILV